MLFPNPKQNEQIMAKPSTPDAKTPAAAASKKSQPKKTATSSSAAPKTVTKTAAKTATKTASKSATTASAPATMSGRKAATAPATAAAIAAAPAVAPVLVTETRGGSTGSELKKRDLVDRVAAHGKLKKSQVKPVVDAMLAVLGQALAEGQEMNLPPLGKIKVNRQKTTAGGQVILIKLRTGSGGGTADASVKPGAGSARQDPEIAAKSADETLAEPAE